MKKYSKVPDNHKHAEEVMSKNNEAESTNHFHILRSSTKQ